LGGDTKNNKDIIKEYVDEYFYRSSAERLMSLKSQKEMLSKQPTIRLMLDILTEDNGYIIDETFQKKIEAFLVQNITLNN
jgi:hypothetical protein